jgi:hypothetical protein
MLNFARGMLARAGGSVLGGTGLRGMGANLLSRPGRMGAVGGAAALGAGRAAWGMARMGNVGLSATLGGIGGGMYGAMSGDTSVLGGALMGAGIGVGALGARNLGGLGRQSYRVARDRGGMGRGKAASVAFSTMAARSASYFGSYLNRARNGFSGMAARGFQGVGGSVVG